MSKINLFNGDAVQILKTLPDNSVDSVVCDPPYGLSKEPDMLEVLKHWMAGDDYTHKGGGFMGKSWDSFVPGPAAWKECLRVLKPGGHLLAFFGSRTYDLGTLAIRLAGFEIRDQIMWIYGSGFPKSLNVQTATASDTWEGWGTALKPAHEPICVARKPLAGTVAANVLTYGTGGLNIDGCRVNPGDKVPGGGNGVSHSGGIMGRQLQDGRDRVQPHTNGRWPANLAHDGSDEVLALFPAKAGASAPVKGTEKSQDSKGDVTGVRDRVPGAFHADSGSAARFFYCPKASKADRNYGLSGETITPSNMVGRKEGSAGIENPRAGAGRTSGSKNPHPTVKPLNLMRWLVRLVTPAGGVVLDPFTGSGSTGAAAMLEGFRFTGIELDAGYFDIAQERIGFARKEYVKMHMPARIKPAPPRIQRG